MEKQVVVRLSVVRCDRLCPLFQRIDGRCEASWSPGPNGEPDRWCPLRAGMATVELATVTGR